MQALVIPQWRLVANITVAGRQFLLAIEIYQFCMFSFLSASVGFKFYLVLWHVIVCCIFIHIAIHILSPSPLLQESMCWSKGLTCCTIVIL